MNILILASNSAIASRLVSAASLLGGTLTLLCLKQPALESMRELAGVDHILQADSWPSATGSQAHALLDLAKNYEHIVGAEGEQNVMAMLGALLQRPVISQVCEVIGAATVNRTSYSGQFIATLHAPQGLFSIQASAFPPCAKRDHLADFSIAHLPCIEEKQRILASSTASGQAMETARVVVGGGKGMGDQGTFNALLRPLAQLLHAEIGGTRSAVEAGMIDHAAQIGQTGRHIAPRIYLAAGISGASQHMAGIGRSGIIIAINHDPDAAIFKVADYGWQAEVQEALPALAKALAERLN
jgi:electron transfer flavoprotein alpha subunit